MYFIAVLVCVFHVLNAGLLSMSRIDACSECTTVAEGEIRCTMWQPGPVVLIVDCPVDTLFSGPGLQVMEVYGKGFRELLLTTSTVRCEDVDTIKLNGRKCRDDVTTTSTTTSAWPWPWPFFEGAGVNQNNTNTTTSSSTQTTARATTESNTLTVAVATWRTNSATVICVTVALIVTTAGIFVVVRCTMRRRQRRMARPIEEPLQVPEISSTSSITPPVSPRRRRQYRNSDGFESVELVKRD